MSASVSAVRQEWAEGFRRIEQQREDRRRYAQLLDQVEAVEDELRRRVGGVYTIAELASAYRDADDWSRETVASRAATQGWPRALAAVTAAAFHRYSRGAVDYVP
jgi:hypothetical protein